VGSVQQQVAKQSRSGTRRAESAPCLEQQRPGAGTGVRRKSFDRAKSRATCKIRVGRQHWVQEALQVRLLVRDGVIESIEG